MFEMKQEKYGDGFSAVALHNDAVEEGSVECVCVCVCCCWHREMLNYSRRRILLDAIVRGRFDIHAPQAPRGRNH